MSKLTFSDLEDIEFIYNSLGGDDKYYFLQISKNDNPILLRLKFWKNILNDFERRKKWIRDCNLLKVERPSLKTIVTYPTKCL